MFAKRRLPVFQQIVGMSLLAAYLSVFLLNNLPHSMLHDHAASIVAHTLEAEKDECHRTLYHAAQNNGCSHQEHFLNHEASCELCDAILTNFWGLYLADGEALGLEFWERNDPYDLEIFAKGLHFKTLSRAPPFRV